MTLAGPLFVLLLVLAVAWFALAACYPTKYLPMSRFEHLRRMTGRKELE